MTLSSFLIPATGLLLAALSPDRKEPPQDDLARLRGTWLTVSLVADGKTLVRENVPPQQGPETKVAFDGNTWRILVGETIVASGVMRIDSTRTPKEIDFMDESGTMNDKTKLAIFDLDGDTYTYCVAPAGKPRPTEFVSEPGSGNALGVSRREKL